MFFSLLRRHVSFHFKRKRRDSRIFKVFFVVQNSVM